MLDIKTLLWCFVFVSSFMAMALLLYRTKQKTYPGYDQWTSGTILLTSGYLLYVLRGETIPLWASIIFANAATLGGAVLRLDGLGRFIAATRISRTWYLLPPLLALICGYFHFIVDNIGIRTLFITILLCLTLFRMAALLIAASQGGTNSLFLAIGMLHLLWGFALAGRFLSMVGQHEWNMFNPFASNVTFFSLGLTLEIGINLSFFMMQSQRLEQDLRLSHQQLSQSNDQLEQKIAEIKVLSGILPICMHCKKIRDVGGDWLQMEIYVSRRTDAEFSHGVCPECMKSIYPHIHQQLSETADTPVESAGERIHLEPHANGTGTIP